MKYCRACPARHVAALPVLRPAGPARRHRPAGGPAGLPAAGRGGPAIPGGRPGRQTGRDCLQDSQQGGPVRGGQEPDHPRHCQVGEGTPQSHAGQSYREGSRIITRADLSEPNTGGGEQANPALQTENRANIASGHPIQYEYHHLLFLVYYD